MSNDVEARLAFESLVMRVLRVTAEFDTCDAVWWRTDGDYAPVTFFVNCNDLFFWASADAEAITEKNIDLLEQSYRDAAAAKQHGEYYASLLFCCRARGMRPQGAYYKSIPAALWPLFDACGPEQDQANPPAGS